MSGLKTTLMGQPPQPSQQSYSSSNQAYPAISSAMTPALNYTTQGGSLMGNMLGVGGAPAQTQALTNFANSGGMDFLRQQGMQGIESNQAAHGLLESGDTLKAMDKFNNGLASTYLNQYMNNLQGFSNLGINAAQVMAQAGQQSHGSSTGATQGKQGVLPTLLSAASMIPGIGPVASIGASALGGAMSGGGLSDLLGGGGSSSSDPFSTGNSSLDMLYPPVG